MGRKIPGRKHRGVKDPEKQAAIRFERIKDKINAPPADPDDQQVPYSLQRIIELKEKVKSGHFDKRKRTQQPPKIVQHKYRGRPEKPVPKFEQRPGESEKLFRHRMTRICEKVTQEAKFENKYGVDIFREENGEVRVEKRPKDELELLIKKKRKEKFEKKKKKKKKGEVVPKLTKSQKWEKKKKEKKLKKKLNQEGHPEHVTDNIKFGEVVHAPPTLVAPRKVQKSEEAPRPGKKQLLLKSLLKPENNSTTKTANRTINKKGKRKDLPNAMRRQLENQQSEIIQAYKDIKAQKYKSK